MSKAVVIDGYEFHLLNGRLWITSEADPDKQVSLSPEAVKGLIEYINRIPEENEPGGARELIRYLLN